MPEVVAFHVVVSTYGFWLPNDPRGSWSNEVRAENIAEFGPATKVATTRSVAGASHDASARLSAKRALVRPEVKFDGPQARSVALGMGELAAQAGYVLYAFAILPQHVHMVIRRHRFAIEQVVRKLRQAGTLRLLADGLHPFADLRGPTGRLPSVWAQDFWKVFLYSPLDVQRAVEYVEANPVRDGKRRQNWSFVTQWR